MLSWPCETSWSKGISLPRPIPYDLQTRMPFCSNWILCSLLKPSILFTSKDFLVSSTAQTHADVPFTGRSENVHVCCCTYIMTFVAESKKSLISKKSKRQTAIPTGWPRSLLQQSASCYGSSLPHPTQINLCDIRLLRLDFL